MTNKIIFLDFDGPMVPGKSIYLAGQTKILSKFDPIAVGFINDLAEKTGAKIVVHSSWIKTAFVFEIMQAHTIPDHMVNQGIKREHIHEDWQVPIKFSSERWSEINWWLDDHPEVTNFVIIDDASFPYNKRFKGKIIKVSYNDGISFDQMLKTFDILKEI